VARRWQDLDPEAIGGDDVAFGQSVGVVGGDAVRRIHGPDSTSRLVREPGRTLGVVRVLVREQYDGDLAGRVQDCAEVVLQHRSGIDHHRLIPVRRPEDPRVGPLQRHHAGVVREHLARVVGDSHSVSR
jgi:hypothetical protein